MKTRLQTAPAGTYTGAIDVVKKAMLKDGAAGCVGLSLLTQGASKPLLLQDCTVVSSLQSLASPQFLPSLSG